MTAQPFKRISPAEVTRDENGFWAHPDLPNFDESIEAFEQWGADNQLQFSATYFEHDAPEELCDEWFGNGIPDCSAWEPTNPEGDGWFMLGIWDTDDGPVCSWARYVEGSGDQGGAA